MLAGCGDIKVVRDDTFNTDDSSSFNYVKSYNIGEKKTTSIGDPIVKWQEITVKNIPGPKMLQSKTDFKIEGDYKRATNMLKSEINITSNKNDNYYLIGTTNYNDNKYSVIALNKEKNKYYLLVNDSGILNKNILIDENVDRKFISENAVSSPENIVFLKVPTTRIIMGVSREVIFGGINNVTLNATYREYTPEDMARQAFYQNLVYQTSADTIRFQNFKIKVHEVTNEKITFTVLEDGLVSPISATK
jgi:hypothetical protein